MVRYCKNEKVLNHIKRTQPKFAEVKEYEEEYHFLPQYFKKETNKYRLRNKREGKCHRGVFRKVLWTEVEIWDKRYNFNIKDPYRWSKWWLSKNIYIRRPEIGIFAENDLENMKYEYDIKEAEAEAVKKFMSEELNLYNPYSNITIEIRNLFRSNDERIDVVMKLKKTRFSFNVIARWLNMSRFITLSKHLKIDNQIIDAILEGKMGPTGNIGLFDDESPPRNNLENEITQFSIYAVFKIKVRNVSNKVHIILKLMIRLIRKKGKLKILVIIEEYWKFLFSYFIRSFCNIQSFFKKWSN
jgi:hypothetical protein